MNFKEAFSKCSKKVRDYHNKLNQIYLGQKIVDVEYGPDCEGDPQVYYFILENGAKIGIARVYLEAQDGRAIVEEENRICSYTDKNGKAYILRFQFHNCENLYNKGKKSK